MRGAEIRFVGTHMDRVTAVVFPVAGEVTEFSKKEATEIRVVVPANAGYGRIVLKTPDGDITTESEMSYSEQIDVTRITEEAVKPGDNIEIKGHFLYLVTRVIFQGTDSFVDLTDADKTFSADDPTGEQTITVTVPESALSGEVILSTIMFDANNNELGIPVEVGSGDWRVNIVEPTVASFSPTTVKAGAKLTIKGEYLDLVDAIRFEGGTETDSFTLNGTTSIEVTVPEDAQDGAITLIAGSGAETVSADDLTMLLPAVSSLAPNPVRNGAKLTVEGTDLDLVSVITFSGADAIAVGDASVTAKTATKIEVSVPVNANDGPVTFTTKAAKEVESAELKLVRPVVTGYASSTVGAGANVTFHGTDLDLVTAVTFPADLVVEVEPNAGNATELTVAIPATASSDGNVTLTMVNGNVIECPPLTIEAPLFAFIPVLPGADVEILAGDLLVVDVVNGDKLTEVQVNGITTQHILRGTSLHILIPADANGPAELKLVSSNGEVAYTIKVTGTGPVETVAWEGIVDMNAAPWRAVAIPFAGFSGAEAGALCRFYFRDGAGDINIQPNYGDWGGAIIELKPAVDAPYAEFELTQENLDKMMNPAWGDAAFQLHGAGCVVYKISYLQ